jgi:hypothetical protein
MANYLALEFLARGYEWDFKDGKRIPTEADMLEALEYADSILTDGHSIFAGRLVITKSDGHTDVYLHQGEIE